MQMLHTNCADITNRIFPITSCDSRAEELASMLPKECALVVLIQTPYSYEEQKRQPISRVTRFVVVPYFSHL